MQAFKALGQICQSCLDYNDNPFKSNVQLSISLSLFCFSLLLYSHLHGAHFKRKETIASEIRLNIHCCVGHFV